MDTFVFPTFSTTLSHLLNCHDKFLCNQQTRQSIMLQESPYKRSRGALLNLFINMNAVQSVSQLEPVLAILAEGTDSGKGATVTSPVALCTLKPAQHANEAVLGEVCTATTFISPFQMPFQAIAKLSIKHSCSKHCLNEMLNMNLIFIFPKNLSCCLSSEIQNNSELN